MVFRADVPLGVGEVVATRVSIDRALPSPGGAGLCVQGFSAFDHPLSGSAVPDRVGMVDYPFDRTVSSDGAFVCFGGVVEILEEGFVGTRSFTVLRLEARDPVAILNLPRNRDLGVVLAYAAVLSESQNCSGPDPADYEIRGAGFFPGSRLRSCVGRPAFGSEIEDADGASRDCVPIRAERGADDDGTDTSAPFRRGDANADGELNITDPIMVVLHVFMSKPVPCEKAVDSDDDGDITMSDVLRTLAFLFLTDPPLDAPFPSCGADPTPDQLGCDMFPPCE